MASYVRGHELSAMTGTNQSTVRIGKLNFAKYYKSTQERGDFHSEQEAFVGLSFHFYFESGDFTEIRIEFWVNFGVNFPQGHGFCVEFLWIRTAYGSRRLC